MKNTEKNFKSLQIEEIVEILQEEGIIIPQRFQERAMLHAMQHYGGKMPPEEAIRAVLKICNYWKQYCADGYEFARLVCSNICTMARIHTAVIYSDGPGDKCYLGNFCKLKEGIQLPSHVSTVATFGGKSFIREQKGFPLKPMR